MTIEEFLKNLLASQNLSPEQERALETNKKEVTDFLRAEFGADPVIKYAGSYAKGTIICESYDLDIVCYFPSSDARTLKEIREDVTTHLSKKYLVQDKASAERITNLKSASAPDGYHIDVVPGRFIENSKDIFLHVAYGEKERMQTNLKAHIDFIANSGCVEAIRLAKLWSHRNNLEIKTFVLEIFVVTSLNGSRNKSNPKLAFLEVLEAMKDDFGSLVLEDPANSGNQISKLISPSHRVMVVNAAEEAWNKVSKSNSVTDWRAVFREADSSNFTFTRSKPTEIKNPSGQWGW